VREPGVALGTHDVTAQRALSLCAVWSAVGALPPALAVVATLSLVLYAIAAPMTPALLLVGVAAGQAVVLRRRVAPVRGWVLASVAGAGLGVAMVHAAVFPLVPVLWGVDTPAAAVVGVSVVPVAGCMGAAQWVALRRALRPPGMSVVLWVAAHLVGAAGWAAAFGGAAATSPQWGYGRNPFPVVLTIVALWAALAGALYALPTGAVLVWLLSRGIGRGA
jgi:hypothetical protein